jgi:hypothetical protein
LSPRMVEDGNFVRFSLVSFSQSPWRLSGRPWKPLRAIETGNHPLSIRRDLESASFENIQNTTRIFGPLLLDNKMCIQVVERYAVCRCIYYIHEVDRCALYGQRGHEVTERVVDVGYACPDHSANSRGRRRMGGTGYARYDAEHSGELHPMEQDYAIEHRSTLGDPIPHWFE